MRMLRNVKLRFWQQEGVPVYPPQKSKLDLNGNI